MASEESKPVKKEEGSNKSSGSKKVTTPKSNAKPKVKKEEPEPKPLKPPTPASRSKVKKEHSDDNDDDDDMPLAKKISNSNSKPKPKKRDPPEEKDPLRIFYETLHKQIPTSEMSLIWLMESGLLPREVAMKVYEKKQKKGLQQKLTSPVKTTAVVKSSTKSVTIKKKSPTSPKKTTNSTSKQSKKRKSECLSSEDDSDYDIGSPKTKRRKAA
ncbi:hypothetical protein SESBI_13578 [Sesbania bispinosa]|nr:hypothetical protein SESBI_13578 [Sesbania bispinosa]